MTHQLSCECGETFDTVSDFHEHYSQARSGEIRETAKSALRSARNMDFLDDTLWDPDTFYIDVAVRNGAKMQIHKLTGKGLNVTTIMMNPSTADYDADTVARMWIEL